MTIITEGARAAVAEATTEAATEAAEAKAVAVAARAAVAVARGAGDDAYDALEAVRANYDRAADEAAYAVAYGYCAVALEVHVADYGRAEETAYAAYSAACAVLARAEADYDVASARAMATSTVLAQAGWP